MTAATNIHMGHHGPTGTNENNNRENGKMNHENDNINMVTRISNVFGNDNISKLVAGAALGLALTIGVAMPGAVRADLPSIATSSSVSRSSALSWSASKV